MKTLIKQNTGASFIKVILRIQIILHSTLASVWLAWLSTQGRACAVCKIGAIRATTRPRPPRVVICNRLTSYTNVFRYTNVNEPKERRP
jgi:hypothetical protein